MWSYGGLKSLNRVHCIDPSLTRASVKVQMFAKSPYTDLASVLYMHLLALENLSKSSNHAGPPFATSTKALSQGIHGPGWPGCA